MLQCHKELGRKLRSCSVQSARCPEEIAAISNAAMASHRCTTPWLGNSTAVVAAPHLRLFASAVSVPSGTASCAFVSGGTAECVNLKTVANTPAMRSIGLDMISGKKLENLKSSLGSPLMLVSGCCWKNRRYSHDRYVPYQRNAKLLNDLVTIARMVAISTNALGKNCSGSNNIM